MLKVRTDENTHARSDEQPTRNRESDTRTLASYLPLMMAAVGNVVVVASVVFFYVESDLRRLVAVTFGLGFLTASVWFAANPLIKNSRRFASLRGEVDEFIELVRALQVQVLERARPEDIENIKAELHEAVERIALVCDEPG